MTGDHLDDDALSATLDGEATPAEAAHAGECPTCRARLDVFRAAANAVGSAVGPVDAARREDAIAAALAAVPASTESRRGRPPTWLYAVAAAVVALAALVPLLTRGDDGADTASRATSKAAAPAPESTGQADASTLAAPPTAVDAGDLGTVGPGDALRDVVVPALAPTPAPEVAAPTPGPPSAAAGSSAAATPCLAEVRSSEPVGALRLSGRATVDGVASEVLVFELPDEPGHLRALAVAPADCHVVRSETFPGS